MAPESWSRTGVMLEIFSVGLGLLSAGIFLAHAYDMVQNAAGQRRV
jgi:hypothetical protein